MTHIAKNHHNRNDNDHHHHYYSVIGVNVMITKVIKGECLLKQLKNSREPAYIEMSLRKF